MEQNVKARNRWIVRPKVRPAADLLLVCFPQAAGNAWSFFGLAEQLPELIELVAVQYPGHGDRLSEQPIREFDTLVRSAAEALAPELDRPYALFGHSMGAILAFEASRLLPALGCPAAEHVLVSGYNAPDTPDLSEELAPMSQLSDEQLLERIAALDCTPREVLEDAEMRELLFRMIRADSAVCSSHTMHDRTPIASPITAFGGWEDPRTTEVGLQGWHAFTSGPFHVHWFAGNHGFLLRRSRRFATD